ncbi:DUF2306 domain-containing protein [Winogradskyella sp.]|uniref:DUF2306 domain-containing protein n=1 Tax=unclassified Winogradskyella TaxID=2615021 RepID=UPI0023531194|nr:DUF2306 domain-containing protein [Winogradskyella sp.]
MKQDPLINKSVILKKISYYAFGVLCVSIGFYPLIYFVIDRKFGLLASKTDTLLSDVLWNFGFYGHIVFGGLALLIGWLQFSRKKRLKNLKIHRNIGKVYVVSVLISGTCGLYIASHATGGLISKVGFGSLAIVWLTTTFLGYRSAQKGKIIKHQYFMIYSYAACFSAVTLRIWLPILSVSFGDFIPAYRIVAWLCWIPNLIVAYLIIQYLKKRNLSL